MNSIKLLSSNKIRFAYDCGYSFCDRFKLTPGSSGVCSDKQVQIYPELSSWFPTETLPGGPALTTIRVAQWMLHLEKGRDRQNKTL